MTGCFTTRELEPGVYLVSELRVDLDLSGAAVPGGGVELLNPHGPGID